MKHKLILILFICLLQGCNFSDGNEKLPGGHTYINEGKCYKYILVNIEGQKNIESCVDEYKYDNNYIVISQISKSDCEKSITQNKQFYIIDVRKKIILGPYPKVKFNSVFSILKIERSLLIQ